MWQPADPDTKKSEFNKISKTRRALLNVQYRQAVQQNTTIRNNSTYKYFNDSKNTRH